MSENMFSFFRLFSIKSILNWAKYTNKHLRLFVLLSVIVFTLAAIFVLAFFCWFSWIPSLLDWGFNNRTWWRGIFGGFGIIYSAMIPFLPLFFTGRLIMGLLQLYAEDGEKKFIENIQKIEEQKKQYEEQLKETDKEGLIPLVTFSKLELESYYKIGLSQTRRSYTYSIVSMWIGFTIIIAGILLYILPVSSVNPNFTNDNSLKILTVASGIISEVISALFLWIYKSSINQITYFYNRQIFVHNALLAFKMTQTMKEPDTAKSIIVEKILDFDQKVQRQLFSKNNPK